MILFQSLTESEKKKHLLTCRIYDNFVPPNLFLTGSGMWDNGLRRPNFMDTEWDY